MTTSFAYQGAYDTSFCLKDTKSNSSLATTVLWYALSLRICHILFLLTSTQRSRVVSPTHKCVERH